MSDGLVFSKFGHSSTKKPLPALSVDQAANRTYRIENLMENKKRWKCHETAKQTIHKSFNQKIIDHKIYDPNFKSILRMQIIMADLGRKKTGKRENMLVDVT